MSENKSGPTPGHTYHWLFWILVLFAGAIMLHKSRAQEKPLHLEKRIVKMSKIRPSRRTQPQTRQASLPRVAYVSSSQATSTTQRRPAPSLAAPCQDRALIKRRLTPAPHNFPLRLHGTSVAEQASDSLATFTLSPKGINLNLRPGERTPSGILLCWIQRKKVVVFYKHRYHLLDTEEDVTADAKRQTPPPAKSARRPLRIKSLRDLHAFRRWMRTRRPKKNAPKGTPRSLPIKKESP